MKRKKAFLDRSKYKDVLQRDETPHCKDKTPNLIEEMKLISL